MLCAQVTKDAWLVHDGNVLTPKGLFLHEMVQEEEPAAKKQRLPSVKIEPLHNGEDVSNLMAVAHFQAELKRAELEGTEPDLEKAEELLEKNPLKWQRTPRSVWMLWSASTSKGTVREIEELSFQRYNKR